MEGDGRRRRRRQGQPPTPGGVEAGDDKANRRADRQRREWAVRRTAFAIAASLVVVLALAAIAIQIPRGDASPTADGEPTTARVERPSGWQNATPAPNETTGKLVLTIDVPSAATVRAPVRCVWSSTTEVSSFDVVPTETTLLGEHVLLTETADDFGMALEIARPGAARYVEDSAQVFAFVGSRYGGTLSMRLEDDGAGGSGSGPAPGSDQLGGAASLSGSFSVNCGVAPAGVPEPSIDPSGVVSRGRATLVIDSPFAASVATHVECEWSSRRHVAYYSFPELFELHGEVVGLDVSDAGSGNAGLSLTRDDGLAAYGGGTARFAAQEYGSGTVAVAFSGLTPDPETYPKGVPLPSPLEPFLRALGGDEAARTLSGRLTWDCGGPPEGAPETELPTAEPTPPGSLVPAFPVAVAEVERAAATIEGEPQCGGWTFGPDGDAVSGDDACGPIEWWVPRKIVEVPAGATLTFSVPGWSLEARPLAIASVAEVDRWRGGRPDSVYVVDATSSTTTALTFAGLPAGDWVVLVQVNGTKADGSALEAGYLFHVRVS